MIIFKNKKILLNYYIKKKIEAGIILEGIEVKLLKLKKFNVDNNYIKFEGNEIYIYNLIIEYKKEIKNFKLKKNMKKKLLLHKEEIIKIKTKYLKKGFTIILYKIYFKKKYIKFKIAIVKRKKEYQKNILNKNIDNKKKIKYKNLNFDYNF
ncbi:putative SsrA-binding protein [Candidatus Zinderia insecticola CARI]|uniref:Putative SsrA-binding protein n=1 Tax=Zinderia insecticola (strain CARI) TaxID=871271 RepID=E0TIR2_ZINIC|nr:putative SsrA-binding protein [Candidatus Zinderia insecticola CARI]